MQTALHPCRRGFTLVEIMIVVAIIAILSAVVVPNYLRARKRGQATRILNDLRLLDSALDQWAIDRERTTGAPASFSDLRPYLKNESQLIHTGADILGNTYGPFTVDSAPRVPDPTFTALSDVAPIEFWSPYR